jgi:hypothetical protein
MTLEESTILASGSERPRERETAVPRDAYLLLRTRKKRVPGRQRIHSATTRKFIGVHD